jgi:hypothetical protein
LQPGWVPLQLGGMLSSPHQQLVSVFPSLSTFVTSICSYNHEP